MSEEINHLNEEERLKAENDFLKMKLMLEKGAQFGKGETDSELTLQLENEFLNYITEFEKQAENPTYIKVFDKIGRPTHFKPVAEIPEEEIDSEWEKLAAYLQQYNISLDVCSPNISTRELYRFTTEELFQHEMDDMNIPGMMHGFIYDEFHPDPVYDNTRAAEDCIRFIFNKEPLKFMYGFRYINLRLNEHTSLTEEECKTIVNRFKLVYDDIKLEECIVINCIVNEKNSYVTGNYKIKATIDKETWQLSGSWKIIFEFDAELGYWYINAVDIEDIHF